MNPLSENPSTEMIRVLVADDELQILDAYRDILQLSRPESSSAELNDLRARLFGMPKSPPVARDTFDLVCCRGAADAVQAVREALDNGRPFDVVFLDMRMPPGPDGLWAATRIRELDELVDIVVATAYSDVSPEEMARQVPPEGSLFYLQKPFHVHEVRQSAIALGRRRRAENRIRQLAYYDEVTRLPNRALFLERLGQALAAAQRHHRPMALLFLDLDNFKRINDSLGHAIGDLLLTEAARRLASSLRASDAVALDRVRAGKELVARLGGDEFTVLLPELNHAEDAGEVAHRLITALSQPLQLGGHEIAITASIGIAVFPDDGTDVDSLVKHADMAMYFTKREGRNGFRFFNESMSSRALERLTMEQGLRRALERGELALHYQPQMDIASGALSGVEALLRWHSPELGDLLPADFMTLAEETALILPIGDWVLRTACDQCQAWRDAGLAVPRMAVNVSARQFSQPGFAASVAQVLAGTGLDPGALELEITESVLMKDGDRALKTLLELKTLGIQLAIDDFGTGYSSLSYLKQFPIDRLKIDRAFVNGVKTDAQDRALTTAIISMADSMKLKVTAEGIETAGQLQFLDTLRCGEGQGFFLSRPLTVSKAEVFLRQQLNGNDDKVLLKSA